MYRVFISYQQADAAFAQRLRAELERFGLAAWLDQGELLPGDEWRESIDQGIKASSALIVVMSPEAKASSYVTYEWAFACGAGVPVIPLLLRPVSPIHPRLESLQFVSFAEEPYPWPDLFKALDLAVHQRGIRSVPIPRDAPAHVKKAVASLDAATAEERRGAIETLGQSGHKTGIEALRHALRHPMKDVRVRSAAALAAAKILDESVARGLLEPWWNQSEEFTQGQRDVCWTAVDQAGPALVPALLAIYASDDSAKYDAAHSIRRHSVNDMALVQVAVNRQNPKELRLAAMDLVAEMRYTSADLKLKELLSEGDEEIKAAARRAIERIEFLASEPER